MALIVLCILLCTSLTLRIVLEIISLLIITFYLMCTYPNFAFILELLTSHNPVGFQRVSVQVTAWIVLKAGTRHSCVHCHVVSSEHMRRVYP